MKALALLDRLQAKSLLPRDQRIVVETEHRLSGTPVETLLLDYGFVDAPVLQNEHDGVARVRVHSRDFVPDAAAVAMLEEGFARRLQILPLAFDPLQRVLTLASAEPGSLPLRDRVQRHLQLRTSTLGGPVSESPCLHYVQAPADDIAVALDRCYGMSLDLEAILDEMIETRVVEALVTDSYRFPIVRLIDAILHDGVSRRASDIHLNPEDGFVRIRYRIDGVLVAVRCLHQRFWPAMVVRIKVLCEMDITETRAPQDGQFSKRIHGRRVHFRVSSFPLRTGENIVLRVLDARQQQRRLADLALPAALQARLVRLLHEPGGLIVVAGPTGCGKSTTLQALLGELDCEALNVMTLEEPVEHPLLHVRQAGVNAARKLDFANGVRGLLRQDPDVLLIGEVRDAESCAMAFRAAMSGHRVLTTVHASDTIQAVARLQDLGVTAAVQAGSLQAIIAQRLLRRRCTHCRDAAHRPASDPGERTRCRVCHGSGYHGRQICMEILEITPALRQCLRSGATSQQLWAQARADGLTELAEAGQALVSGGVTTPEEQQRVFGCSTSGLVTSPVPPADAGCTDEDQRPSAGFEPANDRKSINDSISLSGGGH